MVPAPVLTEVVPEPISFVVQRVSLRFELRDEDLGRSGSTRCPSKTATSALSRAHAL